MSDSINRAPWKNKNGEVKKVWSAVIGSGKADRFCSGHKPVIHNGKLMLSCLDQAGVYSIRCDDVIVYVGYSKCVGQRILVHRHYIKHPQDADYDNDVHAEMYHYLHGHDCRVQPEGLFPSANMEDSTRFAHACEEMLIREFKPRFNQQGNNEFKPFDDADDFDDWIDDVSWDQASPKPQYRLYLVNSEGKAVVDLGQAYML